MTKVAIIIPTKNRSEFLIRQLKYYNSLQCEHPIYICDGSEQQEAEKIKNEIKNFNNLGIKYIKDNSRRSGEAIAVLLENVQEKYFVFSGDDDFQVPNSLSICADFLDKNSDYSSASGYAVSFRLKEGTVTRGILGRLADYPRRQMEQNTAAERLACLMKDFYNSFFSVSRVSAIRPYLNIMNEIQINIISGEWLPCSLIVLAGKTKLLNILSFARQLHNNHDPSFNLFDHIMSPLWAGSCATLKDFLTGRLLEIDKISKEKAQDIAKNAIYDCTLLSLQQLQRGRLETKPKKLGLLKKIKRKIAVTFPGIKSRYYKIKNQPVNIHYQVLESSSPYYKDFKPIYNAFNKNS